MAPRTNPNIFFKAKKPSTYSADQKRAAAEKQAAHMQQAAESGPAESSGLGQAYTAGTDEEPRGAENEPPNDDDGTSEARRLKLQVDRKQTEIDDCYKDLANKDEAIRELEKEVAALRRERDNERKELGVQRDLNRMQASDHQRKVYNMQEQLSKGGNVSDATFAREKEAKEKALELSESLESENVDLKKSMDDLCKEVEKLRAENVTLHEAQDSAEMGEALAKELASRNENDAVILNQISQSLEPILVKLGQEFTADNVIKYVEDLEDQATQQSHRRDASDHSMQSFDNGISVPKTRGGKTTIRKDSLADELERSQYGMGSDDEQDRISDIQEEDEHTLQMSQKDFNGAPKDNDDHTSPSLTNGHATAGTEPSIEINKHNGFKPESPSDLATDESKEATEKISTQSTKIMNEQSQENADEKTSMSTSEPIRNEPTKDLVSGRPESAGSSRSRRRGYLQTMKTNYDAPFFSMNGNSKRGRADFDAALMLDDAAEEKSEQKPTEHLTDGTEATNGELRSDPKPQIVFQDRVILRVRDGTFYEQLNNTPWWLRIIFMLMLLLWAGLTYSNWNERRMWLDANVAYDMITAQNPTILERLTGGKLFG